MICNTILSEDIMSENLETNGLERKTDTESIIYAGFPGPKEAELAGMSMKWAAYPASPEGREQAMRDGYQAISNFEFSHAVEKGNPQPTRYGDIVLDFDAKKDVLDENGVLISRDGDINKALKAVRAFVMMLQQKYGVNPGHLRYYASGGKGFHVVVPRQLMGAEAGDIELPAIYSQMLRSMLNFAANREFWDGIVPDATRDSRKIMLEELCIDSNGFKGGKGQLIRQPHIQRADGNYKVPVTYEEIQDKDAAFFEEIVRADRKPSIETAASEIRSVPALETLFNEAKAQVSIPANKRNILQTVACLESGCTFMEYCREQPEKVSEPQWFMLAKILSRLGPTGRHLFHEYSRKDHVRYNERRAEEKLRHAFQYVHPSCEDVKKEYDCGRNCGVKCPIDLFRKAHADSIGLKNFDHTGDGLVYCSDGEGSEGHERVCSPITVKASARDAESSDWSKIVEVTDPDNIVHACRIPYAALNGTGEDALNILSEAGLRLEPGKQAKARLLYYLKAANPHNRARIVDKNGWIPGETMKFVPYDLGEQLDGGDYLCLRNPVPNQHFRQSGTLTEWQEHVAGKCPGNPIIQILVMAALAGPALLPLGHQGFGIHLTGNSSHGKTTGLFVAASVTGGEMKSWRTTDNGLEGIAELHNDNCLFLDEIGQCDPDTVGPVAYMLSNGKGKSRSSKSGASRRVPEWNLIFLSTGEESIGDRADQGFRNRSMPGHEVRVINILADGGTGHGIFTTIPDGKSASEFADDLKKFGSQHYGMALLMFVEAIKLLPSKLQTIVQKHIEAFMDNYSERNLKAQAQRVAGHFAFLAGVGEIAIQWKILPWPKGDAIKSARFCLDQWLREKHGGDDLVVLKSVEKLFSLVKSEFYGKYGEGHPVKKTDEKGRTCFFIPKDYIIPTICKHYEYDGLVEYLKSKNLLVITRHGTVKTQQSNGYGGNRPYGIFLISDNLYLECPDSIEDSDNYANGLRRKIMDEYAAISDDSMF